MLHSNNITWNALSLNDPLEKERRLCCATNNQPNNLPINEQEDSMSFYPSEKIGETIEKNRLLYNAMLKDKGGSQSKLEVTDTPYEANIKARMTIDDTVVKGKTAQSILHKQEEYFGAGTKQADEMAKVIKHISDYQKVLHLAGQWLNGSISPTELQNSAQQLKEQIDTEKVQELADVLLQSADTAQRKLQAEFPNIAWENVPIADRLNILMETNKTAVQISVICKEMQTEIEEYQSIVKEIMKEYESQKTSEIFGEDTNKVLKRASPFWQRIEWASVNEIIAGYKKWWEQVKKGLSNQSGDRATAVALKLSKLAGIVPWKVLQDVTDNLKEEVEQAGEKERNDIIASLKRNGPGFQDLFKDGGIWDKAQEQQKKLAIIFYAAEHGWLYGIASGDIHTPIAGKVRLIDLFGDEKTAQSVLDELQDMNQTGAKKEQDKGYNRVKALDTQPKIQRELQKAIDDVNLPAIIGIAKRANEKGKDGATNEKILVKIFNAMCDPKIGSTFRMAADAEWFESIGKVNGGNSTLSLGLLIKERNNANIAAKHWDTMQEHKLDPIECIGSSGRAYATAKNKILAINPNLKSEEVSEGIAALLACRDVEVKEPTSGKEHILTIWHSDFDFYRKSVPMTEFNADNFNKDEDYDYSAEISSQLLRSNKVFERILVTGGEGSFPQETSDQARAFLQKVIGNQEKKKGQVKKGVIEKGEYINFMKHIRGNLTSWVRSNLQSNDKIKFATMKDPTGQNPFLLKTLFNKQLADPAVVLEVLLTINPRLPEVVISKLSNGSTAKFIEDYELHTEVESILGSITEPKRSKLIEKYGLQNYVPINAGEVVDNVDQTADSEENDDSVLTV